MSDLGGDTPADDDDTSSGAVTQGGHGPRRGNSMWWVIVFAVILVALGVAWLSTRHGDNVGRGSAMMSSAASHFRSIRLG